MAHYAQHLAHALPQEEVLNHEDELRRLQKRAAIKRRAQQKQQARYLRTMIICVFACILTVSVINVINHAQLARYSKIIGGQEKILAELKIEYEDLQVKLNAAQNISRVEEVAKLQLHMDKPTLSQYRYVSLPAENEQQEQELAPSQESWLDIILRYID